MAKTLLRDYVNAKLDLDNRFFQWVADVFDGDDRVSRLIDKEVSREMRSVLDKPPDIALEGGGKLQIEFCRGTQLLFHKEGHVAMPLALRVADQSPAPPMFPIADEEYSAVMSTPLAIELDRNALGGVLHTLWASGLLDRTLANTTVRAFNEHPTVRDFLSVRIDGAKFHLPPTIDVIGAGDEGLLLRVASRMSFQDGGQRSQANLFAAFQVDSAFLKNSSSKSSHTAPAIALSALELTCTSSDERLHPCYSQIVAQLRANQEQLEEQLGTRFRDLLLRLFTRRTLTASGAPAKFQLESTEFHLEGTRLRANLSGSVQPER